jgi:hypothetical protein
MDLTTGETISEAKGALDALAATTAKAGINTANKMGIIAQGIGTTKIKGILTRRISIDQAYTLNLLSLSTSGDSGKEVTLYTAVLFFITLISE